MRSTSPHIQWRAWVSGNGVPYKKCKPLIMFNPLLTTCRDRPSREPKSTIIINAHIWASCSRIWSKHVAHSCQNVKYKTPLYIRTYILPPRMRSNCFLKIVTRGALMTAAESLFRCLVIVIDKIESHLSLGTLKNQKLPVLRFEACFFKFLQLRTVQSVRQKGIVLLYR